MDYLVILPYITITVDDGLGYTIQVFNWLLPEDHCLYKSNKRSMRNITLSNLVKTCLQYELCQGIQNKTDPYNGVIFHAVPKREEAWENDDSENENSIKAITSYDNQVCFCISSL